MITVSQERKTNVVRQLLKEKDFGGGHYCYNIDLISEIKDGLYKYRGLLRGVKFNYYIVYDNNEPILIVPTEEKGGNVALVGVNEGFDYVDAFYRNDVEISVLRSAFQELLTYFKRKKFKLLKWNYLPEDAKMKNILDETGTINKEKVDCVSIKFDMYSNLYQSLSKSTRQNLRTAENRILKEGKHYNFITNYYKSFPKEQIQQCINIYCKRQKDKYDKGFLNLLLIKTINFNTQMMLKNNGLFTALEIDGKIVAFMFGYVNKKDYSFEVPKLAVDEEYGFYSPGMLLVDKTIEFLSECTDIRKLDLCRGTEQYKLKMGGEIFQTHNYSILL